MKTVEEVVQQWKKKQSKSQNSVMLESIEELTQGRQTKKKVVDLWKLLYVYCGHGYVKSPNMKEQAVLLQWKTEFWEAFDAPFGILLRDVLDNYSDCCSYIVSHASWSDYPEKPSITWLHYNRQEVTEWWVNLHDSDEEKYGHQGSL